MREFTDGSGFAGTIDAGQHDHEGLRGTGIERLRNHFEHVAQFGAQCVA